MRGVIISGGTITDYHLIKSYLLPDDYIICADSGYDHALNMGIIPHMFVGDMDSVKSDIKIENIRVYPEKKDYTDTEIAVQAALQYGCGELLLLGVIGTRMDHTISNIMLLKKLYDMNIPAVIADEYNEIKVAGSRITIEGKAGDLLSLVPITDCYGITTKNLEFPLKSEQLIVGSARGVSNVMLSGQADIEIKQGLALVMKCRD